MPLPILHARYEPTGADLLRLFGQTESHWCAHLGEEIQLDVGTAYSNPKLPGVFEANNTAQVTLPQGMTPAEAFEQVQDHFTERGAKCHYWSMNPSTPAEKNRALVEYLESKGYHAESADVMSMGRIQPIEMPQLAGVKIIPTRAAQRQARELFAESASRFGTPEFADAEMLHLDDPRWDALLALKDGKAVAAAGVLAVGEVGRVDQVYVAKEHRRQGLALLMMARVLESCARSLFKQVVLSVMPTNAPAIALYERFGFRKVGSVTGYFAPGVNIKL